jgi:adenylate cyclase class 2
MPWKIFWNSSATVNIDSRLEIEIKVRIKSLSSYREKLLGLGAEVQCPRALERNLVFDTPCRDLNKQGILLRLRHAGRRNVLTLKMPALGDSAYKVRKETETEISNFGSMEKILRSIGFRPFFTYEKYREVFRLGGVGVMLDETPIGNFLEIEGDPAAIDKAAGGLGFSRDDYLTDSYHRLFLLSGRSGDMVFVR